MKNNKGFIGIGMLIVIIIAALAVGGGVTYYAVQNSHKMEENNQEQISENENSNDQTSAVNPEQENNNSPLSSVLPQYIGSASNSWPPVVQLSSTAYACAVGNTSGDTPTVIQQRVIGLRTYCVSHGGTGYAGGRGHEYRYTTADGTGTKTTNFTLLYQSCGVYGAPTDPTVIQCNTNQTNFTNGLDILIDSLM